MKKANILLFIGLSYIVFFAGCKKQADISVLDIRCEYLSNPDGVDVRKPRLSWIMQSGERNQKQSAYRIIVSSSPEELENENGDIWDTGKVFSDKSNQIEFNGLELTSNRNYYWKVVVWDTEDNPSQWSEPSGWSMGFLEKSDWKAEWIGIITERYDTANYLKESRGNPPSTPSPLLRKTFRTDKDIKQAFAYVSALGLYELRINGKKVGDHLLAPEWTDYSKRVQYQKYDITEILKTGGNCISAILGDGWYIGSFLQWGRYPRRGANYGSLDRKIILQLEIIAEDGTSTTILSDGSWKAYLNGPVRCADMFLGETIDSRKEIPGWTMPEFDDSNWEEVDVFPNQEIDLVAQMNEPIRIIETIKPVELTEPDSGVYLFNLGQNMVGWCRLIVKEPEGSKIVLKHGERVTEEGHLYTLNLRKAKQEDVFIASGEMNDTLEPRFTYHGFQYVEVTGLSKKPDLSMLTGIAISSDTEQSGTFECSNPEINQLWKNILWTHRDNQHSIPTDCPQRDERLGWMGDALVFSQTAIFNMNMAAFYTKWIKDIRDAQSEDGQYADFAPLPNPDQPFLNAPGWADAGIVVPFRIYQNYGDLRIIKEHYESAKRFIDIVHKSNPDLIWKNKSGNNYGDWLNGDLIKSDDYPEEGATMPKEAFATAYFAYSTKLLAEMAKLLDMDEDVIKYRALADSIRMVFNENFVSGDGRISGDTQAGYAIALDFQLLPDTLEKLAVNHLLRRIKDYDGRISTGFHSTILLMKELTDWGYTDIAYKLLESHKIPSWLYPIDIGATTIWERWDGYIEGRGFQDIGMNSFNHYSFGSVAEWMYRTILGINPDNEYPGFKKFFIKPEPGGSLTWAKGSYNSINGPITVDWRIENGYYILSLTVPVNTNATVHIPSINPATIKIDGKDPGSLIEINVVSLEENTGIFELGSGTYEFVSEWDNADTHQ